MATLIALMVDFMDLIPNGKRCLVSINQLMKLHPQKFNMEPKTEGLEELFLFKWGYLEGNNPLRKSHISKPLGLQTTNLPIVKTNVARLGKKQRGRVPIKEVNTFHFSNSFGLDKTSRYGKKER